MDNITSQNCGCNCLCCQDLYYVISVKRCCFFLFTSTVFLLMVVGVIALIVDFILKPQKPVFTLERIRVDSYNLTADSNSNSNLLVSSNASLILNAQNPNKFGIKYDPTKFQVFFKGLSIGVIQVNGFYQAPHSYNLTVASKVLVPCLNVSQIIAEKTNYIIEIKVLGDITVHLQLSHITLPKIKVALECDMNFDYRDLMFKFGVYKTRLQDDHTVAVTTNSKSLSKKCSLPIYI